ncbi:hypothetical protein [Vibrio phage vB_VmeM-Yong XC32]|nr:hypothetical protein [Vibrio phage vB_VmeM-Yong XC31]QAX96483.1 hypothetical protein [Vibrio phage vB_VmeM-Yong XC32]QAX96800.1 hypothetical protein [Vibrio phage vB_VmeM-Yong MS31]QAX97119.1 hypothetical protein [Vibrio phage vB_VmeM-Yong MS32]
MKITFHFFDNRAIGSLLIKARLSEHFSHVGMEFENGAFIHSTMLHGTVMQKLSDQPTEPLASVTIDVDEEAYMEAYEWAVHQVGGKYDYKGIIGFMFAKKWNDENAFFCSELGRKVFEIATGKILKYYNLVTPGELRMLVAMHNLDGK